MIRNPEGWREQKWDGDSGRFATSSKKCRRSTPPVSMTSTSCGWCTATLIPNQTGILGGIETNILWARFILSPASCPGPTTYPVVLSASSLLAGSGVERFDFPPGIMLERKLMDKLEERNGIIGGGIDVAPQLPSCRWESSVGQKRHEWPHEPVATFHPLGSARKCFHRWARISIELSTF